MKNPCPAQAGQGFQSNTIVAFRGERGSYNMEMGMINTPEIVAFRGERGSYNSGRVEQVGVHIVAFRGERGSYNMESHV